MISDWGVETLHWETYNNSEEGHGTGTCRKSYNLKQGAGKKLPKALPCCPISQPDNLTWPPRHPELFLHNFFLCGYVKRYVL
jgi:hypothetical protein